METCSICLDSLDGGVAALTEGRESIGASGGRAEGTSLQRRQRRAYLKLLAAIELRRGTSQRCDKNFLTLQNHRSDS